MHTQAVPWEEATPSCSLGWVQAPLPPPWAQERLRLHTPCPRQTPAQSQELHFSLEAAWSAGLNEKVKVGSRSAE